MNTLRIVPLIVAILLSVPGTTRAQETASTLETAKIEQLTGLKGKPDPHEPVFKISQPRSDIAVSVAGIRMTPAMGFTSWAAFQPVGHEVMLMGDLVLREDQVDPVMTVVLDQGLAVTALHNHFLWETPRILFMHIGGHGTVDTLAAAVGKVFAAVRDNSSVGQRSTEIDVAQTTLDPKLIETLLATAPEKTGEVYKVTLAQATQLAGHPAGKAMGVNTWAAFGGSDSKAVVAGDFAMRERELQSVLKALRHGGLSVTAIHQHMVEESPKIVFLHYWGTGPLRDLALAIKTALAAQTALKEAP
jgi:hypothetical protein